MFKMFSDSQLIQLFMWIYNIDEKLATLIVNNINRTIAVDRYQKEMEKND